MRSRYARRGITAAGVFFLLCATVLLQDATLRRRQRLSAEEDLLYLPRPSVLRALSLGHHELTADLVFVRALVYFGGQLQARDRFHWMDNYLDTIVALDPTWRTPYRWAGVATMYNGQPITNEMVNASSHFLEMGVRQFPTDWELPFMLGCNYLFELHTADPEQRREWQRQGGEWVRHAALVGGAPSWVPLLASTILRREGLNEAAVRHLEEVYVSTQDEATRQEVRARLIALKSKVDFAREQRERAAFDAAWKRTVPYAPPDFFAVVGAPPSPRMDPAALADDAVLRAQAEPED